MVQPSPRGLSLSFKHYNDVLDMRGHFGGGAEAISELHSSNLTCKTLLISLHGCIRFLAVGQISDIRHKSAFFHEIVQLSM